MVLIGEISFLNCVPIFAMLRRSFADPDYRFVTGTPAELNRCLRLGEIDICPSSSIEYARNPDSYLIIPELSIASFGAVKSVLLLSPVPIEELHGAEIALTGESETSVVLLKILLARRYGFTNRFRTAEPESLAKATANGPQLLIGDRALCAALEPDSGYVYDLGQLWYEFTGLPFVFALWLVRRAAIEREPGVFRQLAASLVAAKRLALDNVIEIAGQTTEYRWATTDFLVDYWQFISYDLDESHLRGVRLFFRYAAECGILEREPMVNLYV